MKRNILIIFIALFFPILSTGISHAITVTATPNPATVNQNVTINITATFGGTLTAPPPCTIESNFGNGSPWIDVGTCNFLLTCNLSTNHIYTAPGTYTITARSKTGFCSTPPFAPDPATTLITIQCVTLNMVTASTLPSGTAGQAYSTQLLTSGGQPPINFSLISGALPTGLTLNSTGLISGTPTTMGTYSFTVRATDSCSLGQQNNERTFSLQIQPPPLTVSVSPSSFNVPRGQSSSAGVTYQFTAGSPLFSTILNSDSGSFLVGSETIEVNAFPLTVNVQNGSGRVFETLGIPVRVLERTIQRGSNRFMYQRVFTGSGINLNATVNFTITTEAGAEFNIKRIELYFENKRAEITVERNYPLKANADIRFVGSGLLQGFWEVDGRILSRVDQHLTFGRSVTLQTPEIPSLPTFDTGTHIVRFVITNPVTEIPLASILYFVTPTEFKGRPIGIHLISPENDSMLEYSPLKFQWGKINKTTLFLIQYFDNLNKNPIFSAYTREAFYFLPEFALKNIFSTGQKYYWKVMGFDSENNIIGESTVWNFSFKKLDNFEPF